MESAAAREALGWLAEAADDPAGCLARWENSASGEAELRAGRLWDVLLVPGRLARAALQILRWCAPPSGPVLTDGAGRLGFLVPPGTAERWIGSGVRAVGEGERITVPRPGRPSPGPVRWIVEPDGTGRLGSPELIELALHEAAARLAEW